MDQQRVFCLSGGHPPKGTSEQPSMLKAAGISDQHRPRTPLYCSQPYRKPPYTRLSETLRPRHRQPFAVQVQVHQGKAGAQSMMVLLNPAVSHLLEAEDALQNPERMFDLRSHSGLHSVLGLLYLVHKVLVLPSPAGHILRSRSRLPDGFSLSLISTVAPHLALLAVQQIRQHVFVRHRSRRRAHRMHMALLGVHSDVCLQPEVPLLPLARLMHLRVALSAPVLGRRGRMNNGRTQSSPW